MTISHQYLDRKAAAEWLTACGLTIKASTLAKMMTVGGGPRATKWGRLVRYAESDLEAWAAGRLRVVTSSSEAA